MSVPETRAAWPFMEASLGWNAQCCRVVLVGGETKMSRILLADDDTAFREALRTLLVDAGHNVTTARNGLEAVSAALAAQPDVIVSDIHMPVLGGPEAVSMLRAIPRFSGTPVILMSGEQSGPGIQSSEFLHKPFDPPILLDKVAHLARPHDRRRESERPEHAPIRRQPVAQDVARVDGQIRRGYVFRGLALLAEQEKRMSRLHSGGKDAALATQVYEVLASSVSILMRFQQATA